MNPYYDDSTVRIYLGDCRDVLRSLPEKSAHSCVTSIPYWQLRDYKIPDSIWGGDPLCSHVWTTAGRRRARPDRSSGDHDVNGNGIFVDRIPRGAQEAKI